METAMHTPPILVVAANESASRVFLRSRNEDDLEELTEFAESADYLAHGDPRPAEFCRTNSRTMLRARSKRSEEQLQVFLRRVAVQIDLAAVAHQAGSLVISAPAHVLALLRDFVSTQTRSKLVYEDPAHDHVKKSTQLIDAEMKKIGV
jgi:hypothetical protein